jgi:hypothetical protein
MSLPPQVALLFETARPGAEDAALGLMEFKACQHSKDSPAYSTWVQHSASLTALLEAYVRLCFVPAAAADVLNVGSSLLVPSSALLGDSHGSEQLKQPADVISTAATDAALQAGPGSQEERQLFSLCCSLLKACQLTPTVQNEYNEAKAGCVQQIVLMAASMLLQVTAQLKAPAAAAAADSKSSAAGGASTCQAGVSSSSSRHDGSITARAGSSSSSSVGSLLSLVPWLVLLGRASYHLAAVMNVYRDAEHSSLPPDAGRVRRRVPRPPGYRGEHDSRG